MQSEYTDYFDFSYIHIFGDRTMKNPLAHWKRPLPVPVQVRRNLFSPFDSIFERMMEDFKISISDHVLTIKGEKTVSQKDKGQNYAMREIAYGSYQRNIPLPESAD